MSEGDQNPERSVALSAEAHYRLPAFRFAWRWPWFVSPIVDDPQFEQSENHSSAVFVEQANDVAQRKFVVDEEIADCNGSFSLGIEV